MTDERTDQHIREALVNEAERIEVPEDLAERTMEAAREASAPSRIEGWRARRDARRTGGRATGAHRWAYAGAAAAAMVVVFVAGILVSEEIAGLPGIRQVVGPATTEETTQTDAPAGEPDMGEAPADRPEGAEEPTQQRGAVTADEQAAPEPGAEPESPDVGPPSGIPTLAREAALEIEVAPDEFSEVWETAQGIAEGHGGFITSSESTRDDDTARGELVVRVPAADLDAALGDFRELGTVTSFSSTAQDVGDRLVDLDARIRSARAQEARLIELLERAGNVREMLEIEGRLATVRERIERLEAQRASLEQRVDSSEIRATIVADGEDADPSAGDGRIAEAWEQALDTAVTIFAGLVVVTGFLVPFAFIGFLLWLGVALVRRRIG